MVEAAAVRDLLEASVYQGNLYFKYSISIEVVFRIRFAQALH